MGSVLIDPYKFQTNIMVKMKRLIPYFFCTCFVLLTVQASGQTISVSGTVTNDEGSTLPGVSILV